MASRLGIQTNKKGYEIFTFTFPFNPDTILKIKNTFTHYNWNKIFKVWEVPAFIENYPKLKAILPEPLIVDDSFQNWYTSKLIESETQQKTHRELIDRISNYTFKTAPYEHQKKGFIFNIKNKSAALFYDCGLGKTKTMLDTIAFYFQNNIISKVLIVIPLSVAYTWKNEIPKHTDIPASDYELLVKYPIEVRKKLLAESNKKIYIINYDCLPDMQTEIVLKQFDMIIFDESTYIKSVKAARTKAALEITDGIGVIKEGDKKIHKKIGRPIKYKFALTGTPFGQRIPDVYPQLKVVAPELFKESFWAFRNRYCKMGGFKGYEIVGLQNIDELQKRISQCAMVFKKEECTDLPPKVYETRTFTMSQEEIKVYKELISNLVSMMGQNKIEATIIITQMMKLSQITSGFVIDVEQKVNRFKDNPKLKLLHETLDELSGKSVIWCRFKEDIKIISETLDKGSFVTFTGEDNEAKRGIALKEFQDNPACKYILMTSAGGFGLNLQIASNVIFYSHEFSVEKRQQAEDRVHRIGNKGFVTVISLVGEDTIDEYVIDCCKQKRDVSDGLINNINKIVNGWAK